MICIQNFDLEFPLEIIIKNITSKGCVTSHANTRKRTQTHANTPQTHRKHTANTRKRTQTQTANTRKHSPIAKTAVPVQQIIKRRPKKKIYIHKFHS